MAAAAAYLDSLNQTPLAEEAAELKNLHSKKLWHQLTLRVDDFLKNEFFNQKAELKRFYLDFLKSFESSINQLKLVEIVCRVATAYDPTEAIGFLEQTVPKVKLDKEAHVRCRLEIAQKKLETGDVSGARDILETCQKEVDQSTGWDTTIQAALYKTTAGVYKTANNAEDFFKNSLLFLAYTPLERMSPDERIAIASDLGLAAVLGESIFNFGELLQHAVMDALIGTPWEWLTKMLKAFNNGQLSEYKEVTTQYASQIASQPSLQGKGEKLMEKMRIMCLLEMLFSKKPSDRSVSFSEIAQVTELPVDRVEFLVMRALSKKLIDGMIDQVAQTVHVTRVQARILDLSQVGKMKGKFEAWNKQVSEALTLLENEAPELLA